jgi:peptidoglycan hydrolase-like protein with peptidoglycan-binding domain
MNSRLLSTAAATLLVPFGAIAADELTSLHPEEAYPDNAASLASPGRYAGFIKRVQEKLHERGFAAGPVNGDFGSKTQAALAQFQLFSGLPVNGMPDDLTLAELGVERDDQASAGSSSDNSAAEANPESSAGASGPASGR